jgi:hypothetical protein
MPELDPFDIRLEHAVHAFADRAQTSVDAVAVAGRAMGHRRTGPWAVLGRAVPVPVSLIAVSAVLLAFAGWSISGGGPFPVRIWLGPVATPVATPTAAPSPTPTPSPTPRPTPTIAPDAAAYVTGTGTSTQQSAGTTTLDEDAIAHTNGVLIEVVTEMDDPRVTGTGTYRLRVEASGSLGFASGTLGLVTAGGGWEGTCTGSIWDGLRAGILSCWLEGSGPYAGMTVYLNHRFQGGPVPDDLLGTIFRGEPPSP